MEEKNYLVCAVVFCTFVLGSEKNMNTKLDLLKKKIISSRVCVDLNLPGLFCMLLYP